jgi:chorismate mutase
MRSMQLAILKDKVKKLEALILAYPSKRVQFMKTIAQYEFKIRNGS